MLLTDLRAIFLLSCIIIFVYSFDHPKEVKKALRWAYQDLRKLTREDVKRITAILLVLPFHECGHLRARASSSGVKSSSLYNMSAYRVFSETMADMFKYNVLFATFGLISPVNQSFNALSTKS